MTREEQKNLEMKHAKYFLDLSENYSDVKIIPHEKPDFIFEINEKLIGLEHTQLFILDETGKPKLKIVESSQNKVRDRIRELFGKERIPIVVSLNWHPNKILRSNDIELVSEQVFKLINNNIPEPDSDIILEGTEDIPQSLLSIYIANSSGLSKPNICMFRSAWEANVPIELFEDIIENKERKISSYDSRCNEFWLLIVAEGSAPSSIVFLDPLIHSHRFETSFDRIIFLDILNSEIYYLNQHAV